MGVLVLEVLRWSVLVGVCLAFIALIVGCVAVGFIPPEE